MSLEQVKAILTWPWGKASHEQGGQERELGKQNVKVHPNSCHTLRVPVKITIRDSSGASEICYARTVLVNRRGVRFESPRPMEWPDKRADSKRIGMLWIEVPSTGKATEGKVVWADKHRNRKGLFEFTVRLDGATDLFGLNSLPCKPQLQTSRKPAKPLLAPEKRAVSLLKMADSESKASLISEASDGDVALPDPSSRTVDPRPPTETGAGLTNLIPSASNLTLEAAQEPSPCHNNVSRGSDAVSEHPPHRLNGMRGEAMKETDRLAEVLQEVVESAVQKEEGAASERLVQEVKDQMGATQKEMSENLRREITEQATVLEDQLLQQCRARTEQMLSATLETALRGLSEQMEELAGQTEKRVQKMFASLTEQFEQRSAKALAETTSRIEHQVESATKDIHDRIAQNVLRELTEKQEVMVGQIQQQIGMVTEQNLTRLRGGLTRTLQELAEASQNGGFTV